MLDFTIYFITLISIIYLVSQVVRLRAKNFSLTYDALQAYIDRNIVAEQLSLSLIEIEKEKLAKKKRQTSKLKCIVW